MCPSFDSFTDELLKIAGFGSGGMLLGGAAGALTAKPQLNPATGQMEKPTAGQRIGRGLAGAVVGGMGGRMLGKGVSRIGKTGLGQWAGKLIGR